MKNFKQYTYEHLIQEKYENEFIFILKSKLIQEKLLEYFFNYKNLDLSEFNFGNKLEDLMKNTNFKSFGIIKYYIKDKEYSIIIPIFKQKRMSYHNFYLKGIYGYVSPDSNKLMIELFKEINENVYDYSVTVMGKNLYTGYINGTSRKEITTIEKINQLKDLKTINKSNINSNGPYQYIEYKINQKLNKSEKLKLIDNTKDGIWKLSEVKFKDKKINDHDIEFKSLIYYYFDYYFTKYINYNPLSRASEKEWRKLFDIVKL